jgi:hypothetical protein
MALLGFKKSQESYGKFENINFPFFQIEIILIKQFHSDFAVQELG